MASTSSSHKFATKLSLLMTAVISGLLVVPLLPSLILSSELQVVAGDGRSLLATREASREANNEVNGAAVLAIALAGSAAIGVGMSAVVERNRSSSSRRLAASSTSSTVGLAQVSPALQRKLLRLLHDDRGAANRLLVHASFKYPGQTPDWYADKVLFDLQRDRGKY